MGSTALKRPCEATWPNWHGADLTWSISSERRPAGCPTPTAGGVTKQFREIYNASSVDEANTALQRFESSPLGQKYPQSVNLWRHTWDRFIPFLTIPAGSKKGYLATNSIESLNNELRKATRNRVQFPNDDSAIKTLWLMICNIEDRRAAQRKKERNNAPPLPPADSLKVEKYPNGNRP